MRSSLLVLFLTILLLGLVRSIDVNYDDDYYYMNDEVNTTDEYPVLAAQLNCSEFVVRHEGVKTEEVLPKANPLLDRLKPRLREQPVTPTVSGKSSVEGDGSGAMKDGDGAENESTEKPIRWKDNNKKISKRAVVTIERLWTDDNISIIDGYSKVAIYPIRNRNSVKRETVTEKTTVENDTSECTAPFDNYGELFDWYEIIVENGGRPGNVNATRLTPNKTQVLEPCYRPINNTSPPLEDLLYEYELMDFEKVYRSEKGFLRFAGTPSEFVDIIGELVWPPQHSVRRYYHVSYRKDDTGFYVNVHRRHKCSFENNPMTVTCERVDDFTPCDTKELDEDYPRSLSVALQASLIG